MIWLNNLNVKLRLLGIMLVLLTSACNLSSEGKTELANAQAPETTAVDVAIAKLTSAPPLNVSTGTTAPIKEVLLRAQVDGQLQKLLVEVGDRVRQGQVIGQQDDDVLTGSVNEAVAQREAQVSEVANARRQVGAVKTQVEQAHLTLVQAQGNVLQLQNSARALIEDARLQVQQTRNDADRLTQLVQSGAIAEQQAEQARTQALQAQQNLVNIQASSAQEISQAKTAVKTAEQALQASQSQVAIERGGVDAAQMRVLAQQAVLNQVEEQRSYAVLNAPLEGLVMERLAEEGDLLQEGDEVLRLGDFRQIKIIVQMPERLLSQLQVGQQTQVTLDAFPNRHFTGKILRIAPVANASSRLLPVEVAIANINGRVGGGLLARVIFAQSQQHHILVPETALQINQGRRGSSGQSKNRSPERTAPRSTRGEEQRTCAQNPNGGPQRLECSGSDAPSNRQGTLFVLDTDSANSRVLERKVMLGERRNGQVEIIQGLKPEEAFIVRSSGLLQDGAVVTPSAISKSLPEQQ